MREIKRRWGDEENAAEKVKKRRLEWLGHLAHMSEERIPKSALFGWLPQPHPRCGPRRRWKDVIRRDLTDIEVGEDEWFEEATLSTAGWREICREGVERHSEVSRVQAPAAAREVVCEVCSRTFSREGDKKRHNCLNERSKSVCAQTGAIQCQICGR